jgi:hypothetical protein
MTYKPYKVRVVAYWQTKGETYEAVITMSLDAKSAAHAVSRVKDALANIAQHQVDDVDAIEVKGKA